MLSEVVHEPHLRLAPGSILVGLLVLGLKYLAYVVSQGDVMATAGSSNNTTSRAGASSLPDAIEAHGLTFNWYAARDVGVLSRLTSPLLPYVGARHDAGILLC
jgi:hypothetical protein